MAQDIPGRGSDQFPLRLPDGMREQIKQAAKANKRSMNQEIVDRLEETFFQDKLLPKGLRYTDMSLEYGEAIIERDEVQERYDREYGLDRFDAMKDEILEAIKESKK